MKRTKDQLDKMYRYVDRLIDRDVYERATLGHDLAWPLIELVHRRHVELSGITDQGWEALEGLDDELTRTTFDYNPHP
ncbi:MAG: hypothetical protein ABIN01_21260 [Ferruginibacter sp.]